MFFDTPTSIPTTKVECTTCGHHTIPIQNVDEVTSISPWWQFTIPMYYIPRTTIPS